MKKKLLSYKKSVDLVLNHLKATKEQWNRGELIRRKYYVLAGIDAISDVPTYRLVSCCPISSLANRSASDYRTTGRVFKLSEQAIDDLVAAADNTLRDMKREKEYPKAVLDIRRRMDRIFRS